MFGGRFGDRQGGGVVLTGCGCSPIGILLSVVLSALGTLLVNLLGLRRDY